MDARSVVIGYALGYNAGGGGGKEKEIEVEWKYPDDWLPLPKAGERECILLIRPSADRKKIAILLYTIYDVTNYPDYYINIDWGDGIADMLDNTQITRNNMCEHEYSDDFVGNYALIKIQTTFAYKPEGNMIETAILGFGSSALDHIQNVLAASVGQRVLVINNSRPFDSFYVRFEMTDINEASVNSIYSDREPYTGYYRNIFSVFVGSSTKRIDYTGSPEIFGSDYVSPDNFKSLRTIQGTDSIKKIAFSARPLLNGSYALEKFIFPSLEEMPSSFLQNTYGLRIVYAPKCHKIGSGTLSENYSLQKVTIAKDCEIDENAFRNNYQYVEIIEEE